MSATSRRSVVLAAVGALAGALLIPLAPASAAPTTATATTTAATLDRSERDLRAALEAVVAAGATGVNALVDDGDDVTRLAAGHARLDPDRRLRTGDQARVGSITKTFVAVVMLELQRAGRLDLDDTLESWLPGLVPNGSDITLRMLLNHTSGIFNYTDDPDFFELAFSDPFRPWTARELVDLALENPPVFAPGTSWSYSNTGYILLGMVLQRATHQSVGELLDRHVIGPLDLDDTYLATSPRWRGPHAHGYIPPGVYGAQDYVDTSRWTPTWAGAAGAVVSTPSDLRTFYQALLSGRLLPRASLREMKDVVMPVPEAGYGLGLLVLETPCGTVWGHEGGIPGYVTIAFVDRTGSRAAMLVLSTEPDAEIGAAFGELVATAVCGMFGKDVPADFGTAAARGQAQRWSALTRDLSPAR
ncbi:MAG TPA: serine hydrolase domain-containing protein [Pedococcus sp.]